MYPKLNQKIIAETASVWDKSIPFHQVAVFVMCGGGWIGKFAAEQPGKFYIDDREMDFPFLKRHIYEAVETLVTLAKENGLDPNKMPEMIRFHSCGIF